MKKMNKKGFTLIEMLVVIAIIAVLVSIIIPTVTSATDKAKAASIAANLRSVKAEIVTEMLTVSKPATGTTNTGASGHWVFTFGTDGKITDIDAASDYTPPFDTPANFDVSVSGSDVTVTYKDGDTAQKIEYWANKAK